MNNQEGNELIVKYLDWDFWELDDTQGCYKIPEDFLPEDSICEEFEALYPWEMKFHCSWDWLHEVLYIISLTLDDKDSLDRLLGCSIFSEIEDVYAAVIEYIKSKNEYI